MARIRTEQHFPGMWSAIDDNTYDGPGSAMGWGDTEQEAVSDLLERVESQPLYEEWNDYLEQFQDQGE